MSIIRNINYKSQFPLSDNERDSYQKSIFNDDLIMLFDNFLSTPKEYIGLLEYPNLERHKYLIDIVKNIKNLKTGSSFLLKDDIECYLIPYQENIRPCYYKDGKIYLMKNDDLFNDNLYWIFILLTLYLIKFGEDNELISYRDLYKTFNRYILNTTPELLNDKLFINIFHDEHNVRSFIDVLYILSISNKHRIVPENIETEVNKKFKKIKGLKTIVYDDIDEQKLVFKNELEKQFYFREI